MRAHLEVDGDGERLALLGARHGAAVLARAVLPQLLLRQEDDKLLRQALRVLAQPVLVPEVPCAGFGGVFG